MCVAAIVSGNRSYEAVQCILNTQQCFCVDHSGREIDGTRRLSDEGRPNCTDRSTYTLENGSIEIGVVPSTSRVDYDHWCRQIGYCRPEQGKIYPFLTMFFVLLYVYSTSSTYAMQGTRLGNTPTPCPGAESRGVLQLEHLVAVVSGR